jgi:hypothetical protein
VSFLFPFPLGGGGWGKGALKYKKIKIFVYVFKDIENVQQQIFFIKGTVSLDFLPSVLFIKQYPLGP